MASISKGPGSRRVVQFVAGDGKRKSVRLGKVSQRLAEEVRVKVEALNAAAVAGLSWDAETARWVAGLAPALADKLAAVGLIPKRQQAEAAQLGAFLENYIARRTDVKPNTRRNLEACRARLLDFFGADKALADIFEAHADAFLLFLRERYASGTASRTVKRAKQFFRAAVRARLLSANPFADVRPPSDVNKARNFFVSREMTARVLDACPDAEWRLLFALSRFGGLRCPSEHLTLEWVDVDWERGRFRVSSPKTAHLEGGGVRWVPIFPELRPYLEEAFDLAAVGAVHVIGRYRDGNQNLRTRLRKIIRRAGLEPWPKLFHNLRASRETELAATYPIHVVCAWIGNTARIAAKHYLQVTEADFNRATAGAAESGAVTPEKALQKPVQPTAVSEGQQPPPSPQVPALRDLGQLLSPQVLSCQDVIVPPTGLEPVSSG
jgi:integrase